jgi:hypothetical protein
MRRAPIPPAGGDYKPWQTVMAATPTMSPGLQPRERSFTGLATALEHGAEGVGAGEPLGDLVADVAALEIREDQDVRVALDGSVRVLRGGHGRYEGGVRLHFAIDHGIEAEFGEALLGELRRCASCRRTHASRCPLVEKLRKASRGWRPSERAVGRGGGLGDVDELLGGGALGMTALSA